MFMKAYFAALPTLTQLTLENPDSRSKTSPVYGSGTLNQAIWKYNESAVRIGVKLNGFQAMNYQICYQLAGRIRTVR